MLDSISRQSPGKKDFVVSRQNGKKEHLQKRHLLFSLKEVHALFLRENPTIKIGLSKFSSLRPVNVLLSANMPRNVCLCQYHENIKLICDCLSKKIPDFPTYSGDFVDNFVCSSDAEECMLGKCIKCPNWLDTIIEGTVLEEPTMWCEWERVKVVVPTASKKGSKATKVVTKMKKICKEGTISDVVESLQRKLPTFLQHVFIKRQQSKYFEEKLANLDKEEAVAQVYFAENYNCKYQDEIQSPHWIQEQVTLFTVAVWTKGTAGGDNVCESRVIVSDEMKHDKKAVAVFMSQVIDKFIKKSHPDVKQAYVFSDGPSSQFKNKYIANFLHTLNKIVHIQWNFFATSHGKGVVDGIGGTVKRLVWNAVMSRKSPAIADAQSSVTVSLVNQKEMNDISDSLCLEKCFSEALPLPGISRFHCIEPQGDGSVNCHLYSSQSLIENRPPDVYPYESDDSDSELFNEEIGEDDEDEESSEREDDVESDEESAESEDDVGFVKAVPTQSPSSTERKAYSKCTVKQGIPDELLSLFKRNIPFVLPHYISTHNEAILKGLVAFHGSNLISMNDLQSLVGNVDNQQDKWLTNFVIDEYLKLIQSASQEKDVKVKTLSWEIFEKGESSLVAKHLQQDESPFTQDLILIPCNPTNSTHWFLLAVLPKKKLVTVLESIAGDFVKPTTQKALNKMGSVLKELDPKCNLEEWAFFCNTKDGFPQQSNTYDCGVYTCLYARCLAGLGPMIQEDCLPQFRQCMLSSLHRRILHEIPLPAIELEEYYAVDYVNKYYIGRALSIANQFVKFKFLHRVFDRYVWPGRDDIDRVHVSCVFFGPIALENTGPFVVPDCVQSDIDKIFSDTR